ncbi:uncharacterized mitochondrial protein AtMg00810-like [Lactuca sativa]|uniref:uncharacterized mitochondrial protein AtMg00810-like n=1 Tax=Lactuca sativa TaxID=4236 RepID=UPI000CD9C4C6|nr:uncharacterized mitochondrial protein AtMg00810-like [Lactuca sativa]
MEQPSGFADPHFPNHVCHLKKTLYGLNREGISLLVIKQQSHVLYLLVYVDDITLTGNDLTLIRKFINKLHVEFAIKDLGQLNYFLGLEVSYMEHGDGIFLSQAKYAYDIPTHAQMLNVKPVSTPLSTTDYLMSQGSPYSDPTLYRSLVGALQYLTITRPDLSYVVNQVSQFIHALTIDLYQVVKRILNYVKGTLVYGIHFNSPPESSLIGYSDADWARCIKARHSTYGYSIFLRGNLVS